MRKIKNMTEGSAAKLILFFAVPLMLGNICQQLYTMVDTMIVGQVIGVSALAALGAADWLIWMVQGVMTGLAQGFSIMTSQLYGAENWIRLRHSAGRSYRLIAIISIVVLIVSQITIHPVLIFLNTPEEIVMTSLLYSRIIFAGLPVLAAYNMLASVLRAMGDSRSPLTAMMLASAVNIVLDILFVAFFKWGVAGAAVATVIAQACSALFCYTVIQRIDLLKLEKEDYRKDEELDKQLLKLGSPVAFQNIIISLGGLGVQSVVNGFGFLYVAGFTATNKMYGLLELAAIAFGFSITTYVGQNLGARKIKRIQMGVNSGAMMAIATSVLIMLLMLTAGRPILSLFVSGESNQVIQVLDIAEKYLHVMAYSLWVLYLLHVYRCALQGMGDTVIPMVSGVIELIMRFSCAFFFPLIWGSEGIYFVETFAWAGAAILLAVAYFKRIRKMMKVEDECHDY